MVYNGVYLYYGWHGNRPFNSMEDTMKFVAFIMFVASLLVGCAENTSEYEPIYVKHDVTVDDSEPSEEDVCTGEVSVTQGTWDGSLTATLYEGQICMLNELLQDMRSNKDCKVYNELKGKDKTKMVCRTKLLMSTEYTKYEWECKQDNRMLHTCETITYNK